VWFRDIAHNKNVHRLNGKTLLTPDAGDAASAIMTWHNTHPKSSYYGVPDIIPALGAILGDVSRRDYNISFFENHGVPAYAVFITGDFDPGEPKLLEGDDPDNPTGPTPLEESIEKHFSKMAGEPHSVLVLTIPTSITDDFGGVRFRADREYFTFAFVPEGDFEDIPVAPDIIESLGRVSPEIDAPSTTLPEGDEGDEGDGDEGDGEGDEGDGGTTTTTAEGDATTTTVAGDATTTTTG